MSTHVEEEADKTSAVVKKPNAAGAVAKRTPSSEDDEGKEVMELGSDPMNKAKRKLEFGKEEGLNEAGNTLIDSDGEDVSECFPIHLSYMTEQDRCCFETFEALEENLKPSFQVSHMKHLVAHCGTRNWETLHSLYNTFLIHAEECSLLIEIPGEDLSLTYEATDVIRGNNGRSCARFYLAALFVYGLTGSVDPSGKLYLKDIPAFHNPGLHENAMGFLGRCIDTRNYVWPTGKGVDILHNFLSEYKYGEDFARFYSITKNINTSHPGMVVYPTCGGTGIHGSFHICYHKLNIFWEGHKVLEKIDKKGDLSRRLKTAPMLTQGEHTTKKARRGCLLTRYDEQAVAIQETKLESVKREIEGLERGGGGPPQEREQHPFPRHPRSHLVAHCGSGNWETLFHMYKSFICYGEGWANVLHPKYPHHVGIRPVRFYAAALFVYGLTGSADPSGKII